VVTNAHVVAGERTTSVIDEKGTSLPAIVVAFDPVRDLAVLSVPRLRAAPLSIAVGTAGMEGAVYGHPGGGALQAAPARIGEEIVAVGTNIYRTSKSRRHVFVLAASLAPGDSGGALVDRTGAVIGVAFAIDPGRKGTSYALTDAEVGPVLAAANAGRIADTGSCLVE
jgi:S1-C subfamily serine protease